MGMDIAQGAAFGKPPFQAPQFTSLRTQLRCVLCLPFQLPKSEALATPSLAAQSMISDLLPAPRHPSFV